MKAYVLLGLAFATPALAQAPAAPAGKTPDEATALALQACIDHAATVTLIEAASNRALETKGLKYQLDPPDFLAATRMNVLGKAQYAHSPATEGEIWAAGYDSGACMVFALGTPTAGPEKGLTDYFMAHSRDWHADRATPKAAPGEKISSYSWSPRRGMKLTAIVSVREADPQTRVTVTRTTS